MINNLCVCGPKGSFDIRRVDGDGGAAWQERQEGCSVEGGVTPRELVAERGLVVFIHHRRTGRLEGICSSAEVALVDLGD